MPGAPCPPPPFPAPAAGCVRSGTFSQRHLGGTLSARGPRRTSPAASRVDGADGREMPLHAHGLAPSPRPRVTVREAADGPARRRILHSACHCSPSPHARESGGGGLRNCHRGGEGAEAREPSGHGPPVRFWAEKDDWRRIRALGVRAEGGVQVRGCAAERGSRAVCRAHRACRQLFCKHTAWSRKPVTPV